MKFPYIPISYIIADIRSELKRMNQSGEINEEDCINYAIECIREIGGANYDNDNTAIIKICNYTGFLPDDLYLIDKIFLCYTSPSMQRFGSIWFSDENFIYYTYQLIFPGDAFTGKFCMSGCSKPDMDIADPSYIIKYPNQIKCSIQDCILGTSYITLPKN